MKVFWIVTLLTFCTSVIALLYICASTNQTHLIFSEDSGLLILYFLGFSLFTGSLFGGIAEHGNRQKEKDRTNELMRKYLEKKLREEEKEEEKQS